MPVATFTGRITIVDTPAAAAEAVAELRAGSCIGFDTETKPSFKKGQVNVVSLLQLSDFDRCYLFRLHQTGLTPELIGLLSDPDVTKIGLSTKDDFKVLTRMSPFTPEGFVELQQYVRAFHIADSSLQKIYAIIFGQRISKGQRLSNWDAPELTNAQCVYAATDAWACLKIYRALSEGRFDPLSPDMLHPHDTDQSTTP